MKYCQQCKRRYDDNSLNFCLDDGSQLTFFDTEAETLNNAPRKAAMSPQDIQIEMTNYLKSKVARGTEALIRFDDVAISLGLITKQISENFEVAAEAAECELVGEKTDTRATVRRKPARPARLVRA
jgi:hypothetical protein